MLRNFLSNNGTTHRRLWLAILLPAWVLVGFLAAELLTRLLVDLLLSFSVPLASLNTSLFQTMAAACVYAFAIIIVIGGPWVAVRRRTARKDVGLGRLPEWTDIVAAPAGLIVYFVLSSLLLLGATHFLPWFNAQQVQNTGFSQLSTQFQYVLAFFTLVIVAPFAEELLFRGFLFGRLRKVVPLWVAVLMTSILFGAIHGAWNLAFDTFALSVVLCLLREYTGSIWASILLHMLKNGIAFYILFINPSLFSTL